jgi:hypothetical protein
MSTLLLPRGLGWDQLPGDQALGEKLRAMFGDGVRLEVTKQQLAGQTLYACWVLAMAEDEQHLLVAHPMQEGPAELEWWQRDHTLIGWAVRPSMGDAVDRAIYCARRGQLERYRLTVWRDRLRARMLIFERSTRHPELNYQPRGRQLTRQLFQELTQ